MIIEYREPKSIDELDALFRLRQNVFSKHSALNDMIDNNATHDVDFFDLNSTHYGGFYKGKPISYIRLSGQKESLHTEWVAKIIESQRYTLTEPPFEFPFQRYYPNTEWSKNFINSLSNRNIGEVGKLAIHPNFRNGKTHLNSLVKSFLSHCIEDVKIETGFGSCTLPLERFYRKFGFFQAQDSKPFIYKDLPEAVILQFNV